MGHAGGIELGLERGDGRRVNLARRGLYGLYGLEPRQQRREARLGGLTAARGRIPRIDGGPQISATVRELALDDSKPLQQRDQARLAGGRHGCL